MVTVGPLICKIGSSWETVYSYKLSPPCEGFLSGEDLSRILCTSFNKTLGGHVTTQCSALSKWTSFALKIAAYFGMTEKTLSAISERQPEVFTAYKRGKAKAVVRVASALMRATEEGDMRAIQFFLKTQAGWTEKRYLEINQSEMDEPEDRTLSLELVGKNADGSQYRYSTDDAGNRIIINHDGSVYAG